METIRTMEAFDAWLAARGLRFEAIVVGGAALNLLGVVQRETEDCDVIVPMIPEAIREAAVEFAQHQSAQEGPGLDSDWINNGPASMVPLLRKGWRERLVSVFRGEALALDTLARLDLLGTKLFALCDRGLDRLDCEAMAPTSEELAAIYPWVEGQDGNPGWPEHVRSVFDDLARRLGHGL